MLTDLKTKSINIIKYLSLLRIVVITKAGWKQNFIKSEKCFVFLYVCCNTLQSFINIRQGNTR